MVTSRSLPKDLIARVDDLVDADTVRLVDLFKDIHRNPELGFEEIRTARLIEKALQNLGFDVTKGIGKTGIAATFRNGPGPVVMYRADMDANAVREETGLDYASTVTASREDGTQVPVGHMCGHDAHVTWLIGMANALVAVRDEWSGTVVLIGQPAEELITGAQAMLDDGLYNFIPTPDVLIGLHTAPGPVGMVINPPGTRMAGTDQVDVHFHGVGGHGSMPHKAKDPVRMAAQAALDFTSLVPRTVEPNATAVVSVGSIQAGTDNNVIPSEALVKVNLRWFEPHVREALLGGIRTASESIARAAGMGDDELPDLVLKGASPPLVNTPDLAEAMSASLREIIGAENVVTDMPAVTGSEDAHMLRGPHTDLPFNYLLVGVAAPEVFLDALSRGELVPYYPHNPNYVVDLAAIGFGTKIAAYSVLGLLDPR
ncbi:amidohydrolase [Gordonia spumicola]|uniref:Amidohydrolase n=1 Tax=Gordonia spumicola TaxID=589161 RepID=A0A7I9V8B7_9ACTN|nr:amidohydrolase [Gordonia spumicola]GEE01340.1 amidohydrolase [Gordonia spumicola]